MTRAAPRGGGHPASPAGVRTILAGAFATIPACVGMCRGSDRRNPRCGGWCRGRNFSLPRSREPTPSKRRSPVSPHRPTTGVVLTLAAAALHRPGVQGTEVAHAAVAEKQAPGEGRAASNPSPETISIAYTARCHGRSWWWWRATPVAPPGSPPIGTWSSGVKTGYVVISTGAGFSTKGLSHVALIRPRTGCDGAGGLAPRSVRPLGRRDHLGRSGGGLASGHIRVLFLRVNDGHRRLQLACRWWRSLPC